MKFFLILLNIAFAVFCKAQCAITVSNSESSTIYRGEGIIVSKEFNNVVALSIDGVLNENKRNYLFNMNITTIANEKNSIAPSYVKFNFVDGSSFEFFGQDIETSVQNGIKTQEASFHLSDLKIKHLLEKYISYITISDSSTHVLKIGQGQSEAVKIAVGCIMTSSAKRKNRFVNLIN